MRTSLRLVRVSRRLTKLLRVWLCLIGLLICPAAGGQSQPAQSAASLYRSGAGLASRGLHDLAARDFERFLNEYPDDAQAPLTRYGLAVCRFKLGEFEKAEAALEQIRIDDGFAFGAEVGAMLGQCRMTRGKYGTAVAALARVVKDHPRHELADDATSMLIEALVADGRLDDALKLGDQFDRRWPDSPLRERVLFSRSAANLSRGEHTLAADGFERYLKEFPEGSLRSRAMLLAGRCRDRAGDAERAAEHLTKLLEQPAGDQHAEAALLLAEIRSEQSRPREAATLLDQTLAQPGSGPLRDAAVLMRGRLHVEAGEHDSGAALLEPLAGGGAERADEAKYWLAKSLLRKGEHSRAADRLRAALESNPQSRLRTEMRYDLAVALSRDGKWEQAEEAAAALARDHADHPLATDARAIVAQAMHELGRHEECIAACREFLASGSRHALAADVTFLMAESAYLGKKTERALEGFESFLKSHEEHAQATRARYRLAMCHYLLDRMDVAADQLQAYVRDRSPSDADRAAWLALADIHTTRGEWKQAEPLLRAYLSADKPPAAADDAWFKLGLTLGRMGKTKDALAAFDTLLRDFSSSPACLHAQFERGQLLVSLKEPGAAREAFESVLRSGPDSRFAPHAHQHLAALAAQRGDSREAAERYERAALSGGEGVSASAARLGAAEALLAAQDYAKALEFLDAALADGDVKTARRALAQRAIALARLDRHEDAIRSAREAEQAGEEALPTALDRMMRHESAWCLRKLNRPAEAVAIYEKLIGEPGAAADASALLALAEIDATEGRAEAAVERLNAFGRAVAESPDAATAEQREAALYRLGVCQHKLERFALAAEAMERLLKEFPKTALAASARFFAGDAHARTGANEKAAAHLTWVMENALGDAVHGSGLLRGGEVLAALQRWPASEKALADYLERYPKSEQAFQAKFGVGWARENQGRFDEAIAAYRDAIASHKGPTAARAQFQIGECLIALKRYEDAVRELLNVDIQFAYPEWSAAALHEAGRALEMLGRIGEARAQFQSVVEKHGSTRWAELSRARLKQLESAVPPGRSAVSR